jgi:hypothetical protein
MNHTAKRLYGMACPHCGGRTRIRSSEGITPTYRNALLECLDADCGWRGKLDIVITTTITPSLQPDPRIRVPLSPAVAKRLQAAIDASAPAAAETS